MSIFRRYDPNMQPAGIDEGYLKYAPDLQYYVSLIP